MNPTESPDVTFDTILEDFVRDTRSELAERWQNWELDLSQNEVHEVVGALLARQVTLATQLASSPGIWNGHIAPMILRAMADVYITLAWILKDPQERARKFILYGLGQMKLQLEHWKAEVKNGDTHPERDQMIDAFEAWINSQRWTFLTEVNLGSWSETNTRKMAEEAGCMDFYKYVYVPFSAATHSMWHHVGRYNLDECSNPLHRFHHVPVDPELEIDTYYLHLAGKYLKKTFGLFDDFVGIKLVSPSAFDTFWDRLKDSTEAGTPSS